MSVNKALAERFEQMGQMIELLGGDPFKANAYLRAARTVADLAVDLEPLASDKKELTRLDGIGQKIADKIVEFCASGKIAEHEELLGQVPPGLAQLLKVPGMGPKTARAVWQHMGVTDLAGLKRIIEDGSILHVPRMGAKAVEKLKAALTFAENVEPRVWIGVAMPLAERIVARLAGVPGVRSAAYAGSLRRGRETAADIDVLVAAHAGDAPGVAETLRSMPEVREVLAAGQTKTSVVVSLLMEAGRWDAPVNPGAGMQVDLRVVAPESWGAALMYFTGSKEHNVRMRERALKMGYTLNEYGLFALGESGRAGRARPQDRGQTPAAGRTEEEVFAALGLPWVPPEVREGREELELTQTPRLVELGDIKAELHAHTTASDGRLSIVELAREARARGFHTIAVTDHSRSATIARGLTVERLLEHVEAVRKAGDQVPGITILAGSEVDILPDGSLDYPDDVLAQLDIVVASPHSALTQDREAATARLAAAAANPRVDILGHPTGRQINRRPGLSPDLGPILQAASQSGVALEINSHWMRLDLRDAHARAAIDAGCLIAINCDVHAPAEFDNLRYGVLTARRGWVTPQRCINTWPAPELHGWLRSRRQRAAATPAEHPARSSSPREPATQGRLFSPPRRGAGTPAGRPPRRGRGSSGRSG